jgi:hypothetical protein
MIFIATVFLIGVAAVGVKAYTGVGHVMLQPLALLGIALLASCANRLPKMLQRLLIIGLAIDFFVGILLHLYLQSLIFESVPGSGYNVRYVMSESLNDVIWNNWRAKNLYHIVMLGDYLEPLKTALFAALTIGAAILLYRFATQPHD